MPESITPDELQSVSELLDLVSENDLTELSVTQASGFSITVKTVGPAPEYVAYAAPPMASVAPVAASARPAASAAPAKAEVAARIAVESPMVGTFYRAQTPADPVFVKEGDIIQVGQAVGLIEAMKVYSEIPSDHAGRVTEIVAKNGQLVQLGQPLLYLEAI